MTTKHKHYDLILSWANGAIIQVDTGGEEWQDVDGNAPCWSIYNNYRIKPKPKVKKWKWVVEDNLRGLFVTTLHYQNSSELGTQGMRAVMHIPETMIEVEE